MKRLLILPVLVVMAVAGCSTMPDEDPGYHVRLAPGGCGQVAPLKSAVSNQPSAVSQTKKRSPVSAQRSARQREPSAVSRQDRESELENPQSTIDNAQFTNLPVPPAGRSQS